MTKIKRLNETAYDENILEEVGIEWAIYDYECSGYEGTGNALMYKEGKWYTHDLGHCSCYGPFEELNLHEPYHTLDEAIELLNRSDWSKSYVESIEIIRKKAEKFLKKRA